MLNRHRVKFNQAFLPIKLILKSTFLPEILATENKRNRRWVILAPVRFKFGCPNSAIVKLRIWLIFAKLTDLKKKQLYGKSIWQLVHTRNTPTYLTKKSSSRYDRRLWFGMKANQIQIKLSYPHHPLGRINYMLSSGFRVFDR